MNINIYEQLFDLLAFMVTGIVIGLLFDIFRIIRRSFKTSDFITYIEDIIFWLLAGCILLFTIFTFNNGQIRIYIFIGLILGISIYILIFSKYFIKISVAILTFIKKVFYFPIHIIKKAIKKIIIQPYSFILQKIKKNMTKWIKKPIEKS